MRIRSIKPAYFLHVGLFRLEQNLALPIRLAFAGLWSASDREGRFIWEPMQLKAQILPYDSVDFQVILEALKEAGFIVQYGPVQQYGWIPTFLKHQRPNPREAQSEIPEFTRANLDHAKISTGANLDLPNVTTCANLENHASIPFPSFPVPAPEGRAREGNRLLGFRSRLNVLLKRQENAPWKYDEEYALVEVLKRPDAESELAEIEQFFKQGDFLPKKMSTLLSDWTGQLDRSRAKPNANNRQNGQQRFDRNAGTLNDPSLYDLKAIEKRRALSAAQQLPGSQPGTPEGV